MLLCELFRVYNILKKYFKILNSPIYSVSGKVLLKNLHELELIYATETAIEKFYDQGDSFSGEHENTIISKDHLFI